LRFNRLFKILLLLALPPVGLAADSVYLADFNLGDTLGQTGDLVGVSDTFTFNNNASINGIVVTTAHTSDKTIIISSGISVTGNHVDGAIQVNAPTAMTATGGNITTPTIAGTTYNVHTFSTTGNDNFIVSSLSSLNGGEVDYLIVAGGGGGGSRVGGGGGAGGFRT